METRKLLPLSGIVFVALVVIPIVLSNVKGIPGSTAPAAEVASYYDEHQVMEFITSCAIAAAVPFLVLFAIGVAASGASWDERAGVWERMLVGGSILLGAALLVIATVNLALVDGGNNGASPVALEALNLFNGSVWIAFNPGLGVLMLGAAGTFLSRPRTHRWLGWTALPLGVALFVPFVNFVALLLSVLWIVAAGIALSRRPDQQVGAGENVPANSGHVPLAGGTGAARG